MKRQLHILTLLLFFAFFTVQSQTWNLNYSENQENIEYNPLKGFVNSNNNNRTNFPMSVEFSYIDLDLVFLNWDTYDWAPVEARINAAIDSGNQFFMRFSIDYPGEDSHLPDFLKPLVPTYSYNGSGGGESPNYNDEDLMRALEEFIEAYGDRYNGDPRIAFVDIGLIGRWGEWNYDSETPETYEISDDNSARIFEAFNIAFPDKKISARDPKTVPTSLRTSFGYHDDSFAKNTLRDEDHAYYGRLNQTGLLDIWKTQITGGEVHPVLEVDDMYESWPYIYENTEHQYSTNLVVAINTTHATWMRDNSIFTLNLPYNRENALRASKLLGYKLYTRSVTLATNSNGTVNIEAKIQNKGVAPFYYDWEIEFAAKNESSGQLTPIGRTNWNISGIIENSVDYVKTATTNAISSSGDYKILMRVVNPVEIITSKIKPLRFANTTQDADEEGWLTLGNITIDGNGNTSNCALPYQDPTNVHTFQNVELDPGVFYQTTAIDISCATAGVKISVDILGEGGLDAPNGDNPGDYLNIYYKLNGGAQQLLVSRDEDFDLETIISPTLFGNTLEVIIHAGNTFTSEVYTVSNLKFIESTTLNVTNIESQNISLYPNPVKDILNVNINDPKSYSISLINILGKEVLNKTNISGKQSINVKGFESGIYFARISTDTSQTVKKIIIK